MNKKIVVVSTNWCSQCSVLKDQLTRNNIVYHVIDADENMEFCKENGVRSLPTTFIYEDDKLVKTVVGNKYKEIVE